VVIAATNLFVVVATVVVARVVEAVEVLVVGTVVVAVVVVGIAVVFKVVVIVDGRPRSYLLGVVTVEFCRTTPTADVSFAAVELATPTDEDEDLTTDVASVAFV
jgi:hypothetical protein